MSQKHPTNATTHDSSPITHHPSPVTDDSPSITHHPSPVTRIGITGQNGFIGSHLYNCLGIEEGIERIPFERAYFDDPIKLRKFVRSCDVIVHLAALNRHEDMQVLHDVNVGLVEKVVEAMEAEGVKPHVIFSSSSQEERDNLYGASKREGRRLFEKWAARSGGKCTGMIIPNVFGPFGRPNYNSVVATFCHKLSHGEMPEIHVDGSLKLTYVTDLCKDIIRIARGEITDSPYYAPHCAEKKVSEVLALLNTYKETYFEKQIVPEIRDHFEQCLFNTFFCYINHASFFPGKLTPHADSRGHFVEVLKLDKTGGQVSFSTTVPGITRGDHYHTRKFERFAVIKGKARIQLRKIGTDDVLDFVINAEECPGFVDMPVWYTHNITNIGDDDVYTLFWINEFYDPSDADTYFEKVDKTQ
jgi:UDP-2-acetamido-2,6-beta-L-arabino-hexul-4-ose reductase